MAVLLLLVTLTLIAGGIGQSMYYTPCPPPPDPCDNDFDFKTQYLTFLSNTGDSYLIDNMCVSSFETNDKENNYNLYMSKVFCDGSAANTTYIIQYNSTSGDFSVATPNCLAVTTALGNVGQTVIYKSQIMGGACTSCDGTPTVYEFLGSSPCPQPLTSCELAQIKQMISSSGGCPDIIALPMSLPAQCVTTQTTTNTGSSANCPAPCYNSGYPSYDYNTPTSYPYYNSPTSNPYYNTPTSNPYYNTPTSYPTSNYYPPNSCGCAY